MSNLDTNSATSAAASEYADVGQMAAILNVSPFFLNKLRMSGNGPAFAKWGKMVRYHIPTAKKWAAAQTRRSTSDLGNGEAA